MYYAKIPKVMKKNIYLVGFMGTGKSAVAKALAAKLDRPYLDLDDLIVQKEGRSINEIFEKHGEAVFRKAEKEVVLEVSKKSNLVVSCGGGVVLDAQNIENLKKTGVLIALSAQPEAIYERVKHNTDRPLLKVLNPIEKIKELLHIRKPHYEKADYMIDTTSLSVDEVVDKIIALIQ